MNTFDMQNQLFQQRNQQELVDQFHNQMLRQHTAKGLWGDESHFDPETVKRQKEFDAKYQETKLAIESFDIDAFSNEHQARMERAHKRFEENATLFCESPMEQIETLEDVKAYFNR